MRKLLAGSIAVRPRRHPTSIRPRQNRESGDLMSDRSVVVLAGGLTHEREVSLRSGSRVTEALRRQGIEVAVRDADASLLPWLLDVKPDAAIIALHGGRGENGAVQGVLELAGVPYLGTRS